LCGEFTEGESEQSVPQTKKNVAATKKTWKKTKIDF